MGASIGVRVRVDAPRDHIQSLGQNRIAEYQGAGRDLGMFTAPAINRFSGFSAITGAVGALAL